MNKGQKILQALLGIGFIAARAFSGLALTSFLVFVALFYTPGGGEREHVMVVGADETHESLLLPLREAGYELISVDGVGQARERLLSVGERVNRLHRSVASEVQLVLIADSDQDLRAFYTWLQDASNGLQLLPALGFTTKKGTSFDTFPVLHKPDGDVLKAQVVSKMLPRKQLFADFWRWVRFFPGYDSLGRPMADEIWASTCRTFYLVGGSLFLSLAVALVMVIAAHLWPESLLVRMALNGLNFASGFHILIIGLMYVVITGNIGSFYFGMLVILALGNGTLSDYVALLREEIQRIFSQDYVLAALGRGSSRFRHVMRETGLMLMDVTVTKIPLLVGSTIVLEVLCSYYGLGWYIVKGIGTNPRDINLTMVTTTLIVGGLISVNFLSEAVRMALDPRVKG